MFLFIYKMGVHCYFQFVVKQPIIEKNYENIKL